MTVKILIDLGYVCPQSFLQSPKVSKKQIKVEQLEKK